MQTQINRRATSHSNFFMVDIYIDPIPLYFYSTSNNDNNTNHNMHSRPASHALDSMRRWLNSIEADLFMQNTELGVKTYYVIKHVPIALVPTDSDVLSFLYHYKGGIPHDLQTHWCTDEVSIRDHTNDHGYYIVQFINFMSNENWIEYSHEIAIPLRREE